MYAQVVNRTNPAQPIAIAASLRARELAQRVPMFFPELP